MDMAARIEPVAPSATTTTTATATPAEYTRLHITPLNPDLLPIIIPPSILPNALNISYATIQTFPERGYGFVDLPTMDAEKLKKKLSGSILKGTKIRIEKSRPKKDISLEEPSDSAQVRPSKPKKEPSKKRKRGDEAVPGIEIRERRVKRGWTTPAMAVKFKKDKQKEGKQDKKKLKSKYTTEPECLFKTVLPPNVAANMKDVAMKTEEKKGANARKEAVVHEFSKTTKYATFLRGSSGGSSSKGVAEFIEGKGWVNEDGDVVEHSRIQSRKAAEPKEVEPKANPTSVKFNRVEAKVDSSSVNESDISEDELSDSSSDFEEELDHVTVSASSKIISPEVMEESETSTSGSSLEDSSEISEDESENGVSDTIAKPAATNRTSRLQSSGPPANLSIKIPAPETKATPVKTEVHPLEALYKKSSSMADTQMAPSPAALSFSFFGTDPDGDAETEEAQDNVPVTPFTQRYFESRGIRSAAPTPDTAHANKRFLWPTSNDDKDDEEEGGQEVCSPIRNQGEARKSEATENPESDFQKWFYEHRGDTNRAWKKRRRVAEKEKRHRENKKRQDRAM